MTKFKPGDKVVFKHAPLKDFSKQMKDIALSLKGKEDVIQVVSDNGEVVYTESGWCVRASSLIKYKP